jgi:beta-glucosidase
MTLTKGEILPEDHPNRTNNSRYNIYPHGLFRAIAELTDKLANPLNIPIYVTENGVATQDSAKRNRFYKEYLHELLRAIQHGFPVCGYLTWTAFDNYEWPKTQNSDAAQSDNRQYGLTTVSADGKTLTLKEGAHYFRNLATNFVS